MTILTYNSDGISTITESTDSICLEIASPIINPTDTEEELQFLKELLDENGILYEMSNEYEILIEPQTATINSAQLNLLAYHTILGEQTMKFVVNSTESPLTITTIQ